MLQKSTPETYEVGRGGFKSQNFITKVIDGILKQYRQPATKKPVTKDLGFISHQAHWFVIFGVHGMFI